MATPFLALNQRSGTPQLQRYVNSNPTGIGATFGSADDNTGYIANYYMNKCPTIQFEGDDNFYSVAGDQIYRSTNGSTSWTSVHTFANLGATFQGAKTGLYVLYDNGIPNLVLVYMNYPGGLFYAVVSANGTGWTEYGPFTDTGVIDNATTQPMFCGETIFRGNLVFSTISAASPFLVSVTYNPGTHTISFANSSATSHVINVENNDLCVFNNNLYAIIFSGAITEARLLQLTGGTWISVQTLGTGLSSPGDYQGKWGLFVDGSNMYALFWKSVVDGWQCIQLNSSLTTTDVTTSVIPLGMSGAASPPATSRVGILVDNQSSPGSAPSIYVYYAVDGDPTSILEMYQWNGPASVMTAVDSGGSAADAMPFLKNTQGSTFWTSGDDHVEIVNRSFVANGIRFSFVLYSASGTDTVNVRAWQGSANSEYAITAATLSNPSAGSLSGNSVIGLTADNVTVYQVTWNAITDGFGNGDYFKFVFEQYT